MHYHPVNLYTRETLDLSMGPCTRSGAHYLPTHPFTPPYTSIYRATNISIRVVFAKAVLDLFILGRSLRRPRGWFIILVRRRIPLRWRRCVYKAVSQYRTWVAYFLLYKNSKNKKWIYSRTNMNCSSTVTNMIRKLIRYLCKLVFVSLKEVKFDLAN